MGNKRRNVCKKTWWRGGREIAAFEEGREFIGQDPKKALLSIHFCIALPAKLQFTSRLNRRLLPCHIDNAGHGKSEQSHEKY